MASKEQNYLIIAVCLQIIWGIVPIASTYVMSEIPVELYIAIRWSISGFIFFCFLLLKKKWQKISLIDLIRISLLGIMGYAIASFGTLYGLKIGGVINFALVCSIGPVIVSLLSVWILRERPQKLFYLALPISVAGLLLLALGKYQISSMGVTGLSLGLILGAYALEAFVFVFSKKYKNKVSIIQYLAITQMAASSFMWILQFFYFHQFSQIVRLSSKGIFAALFVSIIACVLCYAILYWLLSYIDGHRLALFDGFHALSATILGYFLFKENISPLMLVGGVFILLGLIIGNWPRPAVQDNREK